MAAWSVAPALDPHDVMAMVYDRGVDLGGRGGPQMDNRNVEQCLPAGTPCDQLPMRRVSVCNALAAATGVVSATPRTPGLTWVGARAARARRLACCRYRHLRDGGRLCHARRSAPRGPLFVDVDFDVGHRPHRVAAERPVLSGHCLRLDAAPPRR